MVTCGSGSLKATLGCGELNAQGITKLNIVGAREDLSWEIGTGNQEEGGC